MVDAVIQQHALSELAKQFDQAIVPVLRATAIGKMLMPVNPQYMNKGIGVLSVETLKYVARGKASIGFDIQKNANDYADVLGNVMKIRSNRTT